MDVSSEYIKMCEKAEEIQAKKNFKPITHYRLTSGDIVDADGDYIGYINNDFDLARHIWLPRQDQLQEMVIPDDEKESNNKYVVLLDDFQDWVLNKCDGLEWSRKVGTVPSMEQLWLAFTMYEKFNKIWDGESWIVKS